MEKPQIKDFLRASVVFIALVVALRADSAP